MTKLSPSLTIYGNYIGRYVSKAADSWETRVEREEVPKQAGYML